MTNGTSTKSTNNAIGPRDVLLGRGGQTNNNNGNIHFRTIVASKQLVYLEAKKRDKKSIAEECVTVVHSQGGRFLRRDEATGDWVEVPLTKAITKASQCLREQLDVRNKRFRESKMYNGKNSKNDDHAKKRKITAGTVTVGTVAPNKSIVKGEDEVVPELEEETMSKFTRTTPVSTNNCDYQAAV